MFTCEPQTTSTPGYFYRMSSDGKKDCIGILYVVSIVTVIVTWCEGSWAWLQVRIDIESVLKAKCKSSVEITNDVIKKGSLSDKNRWKHMIARTRHYIARKYTSSIVLYCQYSWHVRVLLKTLTTRWHIATRMKPNYAQVLESNATLKTHSREA